MTALTAGGPTKRSTAYWIGVAGGFVLVGLLLALAGWKLSSSGALAKRRWEVFGHWTFWRFLLQGYLFNLRAGAIAGVLAMSVGIVLGLARLSLNPVVRWPTTAWIETFRSLPLLSLVLFSFLLIPRYTHWNLPPLYYGIFALVLYNSAVLAEIVRAGVLSLDRGQREAAQSVGLAYWQAMRLVLLPQALRRMVPALVSQVITLIKDTSLLSTILVVELVSRGRVLQSTEGNPLQTYFVVGMIFLVVNLALSRLARRLEVRQRQRYGASAMKVGGMEELTALDVQAEAVLTRRGPASAPSAPSAPA